MIVKPYDAVDALENILNGIDVFMSESKTYTGDISYCFRLGCLYDASLDPDLHRPSYNLHISMSETVFVSAQLELDVSFGLDFTPGEVDRIEQLLATEAMYVMSVHGCKSLIRLRFLENKICMYTVKESLSKP